MVNIEVNGEERQVEENLSLACFAKTSALPERGVAMALNGSIVHRGDWEKVVLKSGDKLVIVNAAYGG